MTRLYREGRTETVRPVTIESSAFVNAINDKSKPVSNLIIYNVMEVHLLMADSILEGRYYEGI